MSSVPSLWPWEDDVAPQPWKLGALAAALVLASQMVRLFPVEPRTWELAFLGLLINFSLAPAGLVALFIPLFALSGLEWVLQDHPGYRRQQGVGLHAVLPVLGAWVLEMALLYTASGWVWWVVLLTGSLLLIGILVAEYAAIDPRSPGYWLAQVGLTVQALVLFFLMTLYLRAAQWRLLWMLLVLVPVAALLTLRLFHLYTFGRWCPVEAAVITLVMAQAMMILYVYPFSPAGYALLLTLILYGLHTVLRNVREGHTWQETLRGLWWTLALLGFVLVWLEWG